MQRIDGVPRSPSSSVGSDGVGFGCCTWCGRPLPLGGLEVYQAGFGRSIYCRSCEDGSVTFSDSEDPALWETSSGVDPPSDSEGVDAPH